LSDSRKDRSPERLARERELEAAKENLSDREEEEQEEQEEDTTSPRALDIHFPFASLSSL
jgi:hypothetical protein